MPDIKVVKVENLGSLKYGNKKVLHLEDGSKWNVSEKKPFYDSVTGPGLYNAEFKEFQGKPYISFLSFKCSLNGQNQPTASVSAGSGTSMPKPNYEAVNEARLKADKARQDDIRLEFYCGIAKDILIANKKDGVDIDMKDVVFNGKQMYQDHLEALETIYLQAIGKAQAKEAIANKQAELAEEEPPF